MTSLSFQQLILTISLLMVGVPMLLLASAALQRRFGRWRGRAAYAGLLLCFAASYWLIIR